MSTRKSVFICNMAIIALCLVSILSYFIMPFWRVKVSYTLTAETLESLLPDNSESGSEEADSLYANLDFAELLDEDITLALSIKLKTADILGSMGGDSEALVGRILEDNVHSIIEQIDPIINDMVKKVVKTVVKSTFKEELKSQVKEKLAEDATNEEVEAELAALGLSDTEIDQKTDQLIDALYEENATVDSVVDVAIDIVQDSISSMRESGKAEYADAELSPEAEADLREQLSSALKNFSKEDGSLDPEGFTSEFLLGMLKGADSGDSSDESSNVASVSLATPLSSSSDLTEEEQDAKEELKKVLTDKLMSSIGGAADVIVMVLQYISYVIFFTFFIWLYPILKILAKLKRRNNAIRLGVPIWFGSIPFVVLCLLPTIALKVLTGPMAGALGEAAGVLSNLSISFFSCSLVSFIIGIVFFVFVIAYYGRLRKALKRGTAFEGVPAQDSETVVEDPVEDVVSEMASEVANESVTETTDE